MNIAFNQSMSKQVTLPHIELFTADLAVLPKPNPSKKKVSTNITDFFNRKRGRKKRFAKKKKRARKAKPCTEIDVIDIRAVNNDKFIEILSSSSGSSSDSS